MNYTYGDKLALIVKADFKWTLEEVYYVKDSLTAGYFWYCKNMKLPQDVKCEKTIHIANKFDK